MSRLWGAARRLAGAVKQQPMNDEIALAIVFVASVAFGLISTLWGLPE